MLKMVADMSTHNPQSGLKETSAPVSATIRSLFLPGPAGRLEALLNEGSAEAHYCVLLCHPHPLGGGTMHNKVVYHAAKVFTQRDWPVLRFNFRGTGLSEGAHDGKDEYQDVLAGLEWLTDEIGKPIVAAGFSFGSAMGLKACSQYSGIQGFAALGLPTHAEGRDYTHPYLKDCHFPKLFLSGNRDQYAPVSELQSILEAAPVPRKFVLVEGADHFFTGHLPAMQAGLAEWLRETYDDPYSQTPQPVTGVRSAQ